MKEGLKAAAVFIGTIIGAGFATGQEVYLYFGKSAPVVAVFSAFLMGALCSLFLWIGNHSKEIKDGEFLFGKYKVLYEILVFICAFITFIAMFSGAEVLIKLIFGYKHMGILCVIVAAIFSMRGLKGLKILNVVAVPLIIVFIAVIFIKNGVVSKEGNYDFFKGITYSGLNVMIAANVMFRIGKTCSKKCIGVAGVASGLGLAVMLFMLTILVNKSGGEMPILIVATKLGLQKIAGVVIFLAVFTTMVSALELSAEKLKKILPYNSLVVPTVCLMAYPVTLVLSFADTVKYLYPFVSVAGIILLCTAIYRAVKIRYFNS